MVKQFDRKYKNEISGREFDDGMKQIFISSVQKEFERERAAIKNATENATENS